MVIPDDHVDDVTELDDETMLDHARLKTAAIEATRRDLNPEGFNTGMNLGGDAAGGSIDHLHTHVVPRWNGDTSFMPVVGETKVIVEGLERTYDHLHDAFAAGDHVVDAGGVENGEAVRLSFATE